MRKKFKTLKLFTIILLVFLSFQITSVVFASQEKVSPQELYEYAWKITGKIVDRTEFGDWRVGPTGLGPGSLNINQSTTLNRSFTNSISGCYPIGVSTIAASLGTTIGVAKTYGTSYTITLRDGERKTIIFRPKIKVWKITQTYYQYPVGMIGDPVALDTKVAYGI